uniref:CS domain-containing protein n=1 Tax=Craspedostauros australis TaxID=1486917 RepID=A0A7R9WNR7_9STRA|mmetsp:Transcript_13535/g.37321  ORF Transcript_13535/g.37321 Transcript_13535/m.37321 type:complete len:291 (+) Transcript_13535:76-948(+)
MPGIDYSKWDKLDEYSSSSDDDDGGDHDNDGGAPTPQVTRLDAPSSVTFGGGKQGATVQPMAAPPKATKSSGAQPKIEEIGEGPLKPASGRGATSQTKEAGIDKDEIKWTDHGGKLTTKSGDTLYWSQDRYSVTMRFEIKEDATTVPSSKFKISDHGILAFADRFHGVGSMKPSLKIHKADVLWFSDELPHPAHFAQDEEDVEWIVERSSDAVRRFLMFTVYKAVPMHGMFIWWKRPFLQFDEIDPRPSATDGKSDASGDTDRSKAFLQAWDEAHKQFREKERKPPTVIE